MPFGGVRFEENRGQAAAGIRYIARARGQQVFLSDREIVLSPPNGPGTRMSFAGAAPARWEPVGASQETISYYLGKDPAKWVKAAPMYERVAWRGVYPGIDVVVYGRGDRLEYDLVLAPGADPSRVRLRLTGGGIRHHVPEIYQETAAGRRVKVAGGFEAAGGDLFRLKLGPYEPSRTVVVDPVIEAATYIGGERDDEIVAVGEVFVAGNTRSLAFPGATVALRASRDVFLRGTGALVPGYTSGKALYGIVVIGGSDDDELAAAGTSGSSNDTVYLAGTTRSTDFPSTGTSTYRGGASDGFVATFYASPQVLTFRGASYIGGSGEDRITSLDMAASTPAIAGVTDSPDLGPVAGPQRSLAGGKDAFFGIRLRDGWTFGYLGGSGDDAAFAVSWRSPTIWIGGETRSPDFPFHAPGLNGPSDAVLARVTLPSGPAGEFGLTSYRIGGSGEDSIRALSATPSGVISAYGYETIARPQLGEWIGFAGSTTSPDLSLPNAAQSQPGGESDAFAGMWDASASQSVWLTYLGGSGADEATCIARNWAGDFYVGGWTRSTDLPVSTPLQATAAGGEDGLFAVLETDGTLRHLTYYGGSGDDRIRSVRLIYNTIPRVAGSTTSTDLPEVQRAQSRGQGGEGFWADIGTDHLIGTSQMILAKDGMARFSVQAGRTLYGVPVTYRSSDPSRVRFVYLGRSVDEVTARAEDIMAVEALADSGEVEITATAPGFLQKRIRVKLYPGVFVGSSPSGYLSTWGGASYLYASYRALDPSTDQPIGDTLSLRPGIPAPAIQWSLSDPGIFEMTVAGNMRQIHALRPGQARLTLSVEGFRVLQPEQTVTAEAPQLLFAKDLRLAQDTQASLQAGFGFGQMYLNTGYRGWLTARSTDPGRLLLTASPELEGRESVTVAMSGAGPTILAQALSGEGQVQVIFTSSEFDGEIPMTVTLEPAVLRWGVRTYTGGGESVLSSTIPLTMGAEPTAPQLVIEGESGAPVSSRRPGAPPVTLTLATSDPRVAEINRLTVTLGAGNAKYTLRGIAPGSADLTLTASGGNLRVANPTVRVEVQERKPVAPSFPATVLAGKDLQATVQFSFVPIKAAAQQATVVSDDPSALLVSTAMTARGSERVSLAPRTDSTEYVFYLQALKSQGEVRVRVRLPEVDEQQFKVTLLPAGVGFRRIGDYGAASGFNLRATVTAWAIDGESGIGLSQQIPQPGVSIPVAIRSEGSAVRLSRDSLTLTTEAANGTFDYTLPAAGGQTTLIVEAGGGFASPLPLARSVVQTAVAVVGTVGGNMLLSRDTVAQMTFRSSTTSEVTVTSSDPQLVTISTSPAQEGSASVRFPGNAVPGLYLHGLDEAGVATIRFESEGAAPVELRAALQPLQVYISGSAEVARGAISRPQVVLSASSLRPGAGPFRFSVRSADPSIATVSPQSFELSGSTPVTLEVTGVAAGSTQLLLDCPQQVYFANGSFTVTVSDGQSQTTQIPVYTLGKNLQGGVQIDLGASIPNSTILTITSSDPERLLLSRSVSSAGTGSINVTVPANSRTTQLFYLQALGDSGEVALQSGGKTIANVRLAASWWGCNPAAGVRMSLTAGSTQQIYCGPRYTGMGSASSYPPVQLSDLRSRPGADGGTVRFSSSDSGVVTLSPESVAVASLNGSITLTLAGVAPGQAEVRVEQPEGFRAAEDGSGAVPVSVVLPEVTASCGQEMSLGKDTQVTCTVRIKEGVTLTATSQQPGLLLVSNDPKQAGSATARATAGRDGANVTLQGLAACGTAEVILAAPGYQDLRLPVALIQPQLVVSQYSGSTLTVAKGVSTNLTVSMRGRGFQQPGARAGATVTATWSTSPEGIVSLDPVRLTFTEQGSASATLKGLAAGSTLLRLIPPEGFTVSGSPVAVTVTP